MGDRRLLPLSHRVAFSLFALITLVLSARGFFRLFLRIRRGRKDTDPRRDHLARRVWYAFKTTLLQQRVFRRRPVLSTFHSFIFYAFVLYLLVNTVDAAKGFIPLWSVASPLGRALYGSLTDGFSVLAILGVLAFVLRRFLMKSRRDFSFHPSTLLHESVRGGCIQRDSLIVSVFILFHVGSRITGNAALLALDGPDKYQPFSSLLARAFVGHHAMAWRIFGYWGALGSVLLFLVYFPYSKHIHLVMAPLKYLFSRSARAGELPAMTMDVDAAEPVAGAAQLADLSWPRLLDAYACIQCNRCQDVCPASQTGKALSPAALEINKRMVLNEIAGEVSPLALAGKASFESGESAGPALLQTVISPESVWACTTCGACMEVCPTQDEQMLDIIDLRRNLVMIEGQFPAQLQSAFRGMERAGNPWGISREKRMEWAGSMHVPTVDEVPEPDVLYWVGCAASYDPGAQKTARAIVQLLNEANVRYAVLGKRESCTGDSARRAGNELLYQQLATEAIQTLHEVRPKLVIASCPHCVNIIGSEYPQLGGRFTVMHHTEYFQSMIEQGKLQVAGSDTAVTFHDPCYLGRHRGTYEQPRSVLKILTNSYVELPRCKENSFCCGAGGAQFWKEEERGMERISDNRFREAQQTLLPAGKEKVLAVGCPFCKSMLQSTPSAAEDSTIAIKDVAELLLEGVQKAKGVPEVQRQAPYPATPATPSSIGVLVAAEEGPMSPSLLASMPEATANLPREEEEALLVKSQEAKTSAETSRNTLQPSVNQPEQPDAQSPGRKKWAPKSLASSIASTDRADIPTDHSVQRAQTAEPDTVVPPSPPARKKWKPGGDR
jgi:Fe-S oxidoreductase